MRFLLIFLCLTSCSATAAKSKPQTQIQAKGPRLPRPNPNHHLIVLDAGHGGYDHGANSKACKEKELSLKTTLAAKKYLTQMGYRVILTRTKDLFIPLKTRTSTANKTNGQLFVSLHFNAAKNPKASGIEVFYYNSQSMWRRTSSKRLAKNVLTQLLSATGAPSRAVKVGNFHVIRETKMPSILVEGGFITHPEEQARLLDAAYIDRIARSVAIGVDKYFRT